MRLLSIALVVALWAPTALAEIMVAESVEWMTNDTPVVVMGKVQQVKDEGDWRDVTIAIKEIFKGDLKEKTLTFRSSIESSKAVNWKATHSEMLLFLRKATIAQDGKALSGQWTLRTALENHGNPAIDLSKPKYVYGMDMTALGKSEDILKRIREWAKQPSPAEDAQRPNIILVPEGALPLEIPFESAIFRDIYAGSTCYLLVPAAEEFRQKIKDMAASKQATTRAQGALLLANYPGDETKQILQKLLSDKAQVYVVQRSGNTLKTVAEAATVSLEQLRKRAASQPATQPIT
jgi:hypothetical protein